MAVAFISHRTCDAELAKKLAADLEARGHEARLDVLELEVGDSIIGWMGEAIGVADAVVLCYSAAGVQAPWMSREWLSALARQLNGEGIRVLPVRFPGSEPPPLLADLRYADAAEDWGRAVAELHRALERSSPA